MLLRQFTEQDYLFLDSWLSHRGLPVPDRTLIPATTLVVDSGKMDSQPMAMASLYLDSTVGVGHIDWLCTRPELDLKRSTMAVKMLLEGLEEVGNVLFPDRFLMIGCVRNETMANWAKRAGFTPTGTVEMILKRNDHDRRTTRDEPRDHSCGDRGSILSPEEGRQGAGGSS